MSCLLALVEIGWGGVIFRSAIAESKDADRLKYSQAHKSSHLGRIHKTAPWEHHLIDERPQCDERFSDQRRVVFFLMKLSTSLTASDPAMMVR